MATKLIVTTAFDQYSVGQEITDPAAMVAALKDHSDRVVAVSYQPIEVKGQ